MTGSETACKQHFCQQVWAKCLLHFAALKNQRRVPITCENPDHLEDPEAQKLAAVIPELVESFILAPVGCNQNVHEYCVPVMSFDSWLAEGILITVESLYTEEILQDGCPRCLPMLEQRFVLCTIRQKAEMSTTLGKQSSGFQQGR